ncbi:MAG TPA: PilZ domain-containing protein [Polyangia bacterium]
MRILSAWFESGADFLKNYNERMNGGSFYYPTAAELQVDEPVLLEVRIPELPNRMLMRGRVSTVDLKHQGAWITFLPEDQETQDFVVSVARGDITVETTVVRKHQRYPLEMPVDWKANDSEDVFISSTADLSAGGAFVRTLAPPPVGTPVALVLAPTRGAVLTITGRVSWARQDAGAEGMGVRFEQPTSETTKALREALRKMDESAMLVAQPMAQPGAEEKK